MPLVKIDIKDLILIRYIAHYQDDNALYWKALFYIKSYYMR